MIGNNSITQIAHIFCGDAEDYYSYKSGSELVRFFNQHFHAGDVYQSGFPSRWAYVHDKIVGLLNSGRIDSFFSIIFSKEYLMKEKSIGEVAAAELSENIVRKINELLRSDMCRITHKNGKYHLVNDDDDLILIGSGGFANVYKQKSTGLVVKKLKDDFLTDPGIRSRFKREYSITKSLQGEYGIIQVYTFDEENCSYTMEPAEITLEKYIINNDLDESKKLKCIRQILYIMSAVHKKDIIHRDISANNIFIISGQLKIADFGLGKDLNVFTSHQTLHTNSVGQYIYCAPEQFMMLKDADKRSDVYSLGRLINFIMTGDASNSHHIYRNVAEKASYSDAAYRYGDASQLSAFFEKAVSYHANAENKERVEQKITNGEYDTEVENYIYDLDSEKIAEEILADKQGVADSLFRFMSENEEHAQYIIQSIDNSFREVCRGSFAAFDKFSSFATRVLYGDFTFVIKEIAARILRYVAWDVNRFSAQDMVKRLIHSGIEPMLEDIIKQ